MHFLINVQGLRIEIEMWKYIIWKHTRSPHGFIIGKYNLENGFCRIFFIIIFLLIHLIYQTMIALTALNIDALIIDDRPLWLVLSSIGRSGQ